MLPVPEGGTVALVLPDETRVTTWSRPGVGTYELDPATGLLTFAPELGYTGSPSVDFEVTDAYGQNGGATYTATVDPPPAPVAAPRTSSGVGAALQTAVLPVPAGGAATLLDDTTPVATLTVPGEGSYGYDAATGKVSFLDYVAVHDCGTMVNPMTLAGHVRGGTAQGIGTALYERYHYDDNGQLLTGSLADYAIPRADVLPDIEVLSTVTPSPHHPLGVKGIGEAGTIASTCAVYNAVVDALTPFRVQNIQMPLTPERVWRAIRDQRKGA
jgi:CshA-type fibril repeat protein